jgi:hypothetical protein
MIGKPEGWFVLVILVLSVCVCMRSSGCHRWGHEKVAIVPLGSRSGSRIVTGSATDSVRHSSAPTAAIAPSVTVLPRSTFSELREC